MKKMRAGVIYKAKRGCVHDPERPQYNCYSPVEYADHCTLGDCWVCDKNGKVHPGYNVSPVPVCVDSLGKIIGRRNRYEEEN